MYEQFTRATDTGNVTHDPARHIEYVRQALRQDKSPIGFFVGAGCPVSIRISGKEGGDPQPLLPDIAGMTAHVRAELEASENAESFARLVATFDDADPNLEETLSAVRALAAVVGSGTVHGLDRDALAKLEQAISASVVTLASVACLRLRTRTGHLRPGRERVVRVKPIEVFTTNYDLLLEQALEETRVSYFDGFVGARHPFFDIAAIEYDEVPSRWVRLWKLHGVDQLAARGDSGRDADGRAERWRPRPYPSVASQVRRESSHAVSRTVRSTPSIPSRARCRASDLRVFVQ